MKDQKPVNPQAVFCPNETCLARGQIGKGDISIHSQEERRYKCNVCQQTFVETQGIPFYRAHKDPVEIGIVIALLVHGCPVPAIVAAYGWDERTVKRLQAEAGAHCQSVHEQLLVQDPSAARPSQTPGTTFPGLPGTQKTVAYLTTVPCGATNPG